MPLWEAILGGHDAVTKLLADNGGSLNSGDVGHFACTAAEQNNLKLLKEIVRYGGDITRCRSNGTTALHVAVCEDNTEIVKYLLVQGAEIDKPDLHSWTPRDLADQQGHEEIKAIFQSSKESKDRHITATAIPEKVRYLGRFTSEPTIRPVPQDGSFQGGEVSVGRTRPRRRTNNFHNSLFGIMSAAHTGEKDMLFSVTTPRNAKNDVSNQARVTVSCTGKGEVARKLVLLPGSFEELLDIGVKKFGFLPSKVVTKDGAEIDSVEVIRDGDHLVFVSDGNGNEEADHTQNIDCNGYL